MRAFWLSLTLTGLALTTVTSAALAAPTQAERSKAAWRMEEGKRALNKGNTDDAVKAFREAHEVLGLPTSGLLLTRALVKKGALSEALRVAKTVAATPAAGKEAFSLTSARAECATLADELNKQVPKLRIQTQDPASVKIDGEQVAGKDGLWRVDPGKHTLSATGAAETEITLAEFEEKRIELGPSAAGGSGEGTPGSGPAQGADTTAKPGAKPATKKADAESSSGNPGATAASLIGFGSFAAGGGLGLGAFLSSKKTLDDLDKRCGGACAGYLARNERDAERIQLIGFIGFGVAGAGLITGIVGAAVAGSAAGSEQAKLELGPGYASVSVPWH